MKQIDWDFADLPQSQRQYGVHFFHQYAAKFIPQIPFNLINQYAKKNDIIVDPFMGSGTTLIESKIHGYNSYGLDTNPLAIKIVQAKNLQLNKEIIEEIDCFLKWLHNNKENKLMTHRTSFGVELFPGSQNWFRDDISFKIHSILLEHNKYSIESQNFIEIGLSHLLKGMSNARMDSVLPVLPKEPIYVDRKHYYREVNNQTRNIPVYDRVYSHLRRMKFAIEEFNKTTNKDIICQPILGDSRRLSEYIPKCNLIVTSPPYWTAQNYQDNQMLSFNLFGLNIERNDEIGRDGKTYLKDMEEVFVQIAKICEGFFILVIGEDEKNYTHEKLDKIARDIGFLMKNKISRRISNQKSRAKQIQIEYIYIYSI